MDALLLGWLQRQGAAEYAAVPDKGGAASEGHGQPLVGVDRQGVSLRETFEKRCDLGIEDPKPAVRSVDMQPDSLVPAELQRLGDRIDRPGVHRAGAGDQGDRSAPGLLVLLQPGAQSPDGPGE